MRILTLSDKLEEPHHNGDILNPCFPMDYLDRSTFPFSWTQGDCWLEYGSFEYSGAREGAAVFIPVQFLKPSEFVPIITCRN